jgi:hypothetical protein
MDQKHFIRGFILVLFLFISLSVSADLKTVYVYKTDAMMNMPAQVTTYTTYVKGDKVRMDIENKFNIYYYDKDKSFYLVYPTTKQFSKIKYEKVKHLVAMSANMLGEVKVESNTVPGSGKIGEWITFTKIISVKTNIFKMDVTIAFTKAVKRHDSLMNFYLEMNKYQGGMGEFSKEIIETDGYPVKFDGVITMGGKEYKTESLTQEMLEMSLDDTLFIIPDDYKEVPLNLNDFRVALQ